MNAFGDNPRPPRAIVAVPELSGGRLATEALERLGCQVDEAIDGHHALGMALESPPVLLLVDADTAGLDGFAVCDRVRHSDAPQWLQIVIVTPADDTTAGPRAFQAGATDFLPHPVDWGVWAQRARFLIRAAAETARLADSRSRLEQAQRIGSLGSWELDATGHRFTGSAELWRILGRPRGPGSGLDDLVGVHEADCTYVRETRRSAISGGEPYAIDYRIVRGDGRIRNVHERGEVVRERTGAVLGLAGTLQDETERRQHEESIRHMTYHDPLTALPNRRAMREQLESHIAESAWRGVGGLLLHVDLGALQRVNASLGHDAGDHLLRRMARSLQDFTLGNAPLAGTYVARVGGEALGLLVPEIRVPQQALEVATTVATHLSGPVQIQDDEVMVSARVGAVRIPQQGRNPLKLLQGAQTAAHAAPPRPEGSACLLTSDLEAAPRDRLSMEGRLPRALDRGEFLLEYQPIVDAGTGLVHAVEALIRWQSPELGLVEPARFIPPAEEMGLIDKISEWVLRHACGDADTWATLPSEAPRVAVNLSATSLCGQQDIVGVTRRVLAETGFPPERLELELTESVLVEAIGQITPVLESLRALGVSLSLDDFGTGFSSLSYLARFPMDRLKLDRTFVTDVPGSHRNESVVAAIIAMAHGLGLDVIAEGVETERQLDFLRAHGVDYLQGLLISPPVAASEILEILSTGRPLVAPAPSRKRAV